METINNTNSTKTKMINGRLAVGGFLALHGAMNAFMLATPTVDGSAGNFITHGGRSWLLNPLGIDGAGVEMIGVVLALAAAFCFIVGAAAYLGRVHVQARPLILAAAICSLTMLIVFWNDWVVAGALINVVIIVLCFVRGGSFFEEA